MKAREEAEAGVEVGEMAIGVLWSWSWVVAALVILATICIALQNQNLSIASLPIIGDSVLLLRGPRDFLLERFARCGDMFTMSFMGKKILVVNSPDAIKFVLSTAHTSFSDGHTEQFKQLLGEGKFVEPGRHPLYRKAVLGAVTGEGLQSLLPFINSLAQKTVKSWENQPVVNTIEEAHKLVFKVGMHVLWRDPDMDSEEMEQIRNEMLFITGAITAVPINFPGFYFHEALKTRKVFKSRIQKAISKRRESGSEVNDLLNAFMNIKEFEVPDYDICCMMTGMLFAASATTAAFIPWVLKYLHDFPEVRQRVQDEQDSIRQKLAEDKSLSWFKLKNSMPYTLQVINEILRIESLAFFVPRRANKDVEYNDFVFHKGSVVWASTVSVHFNPEYYPDPWKFDPSRFEEKPRPNTFMVFGQGPRLCPGSELSMMETILLIHHLITNYSWERRGPVEGATHVPIRRPVGFPIRLVKRHTS